VGVLLIARGMAVANQGKCREWVRGGLLLISSLVVGGSTVWVGSESALNIGVALLGAGILVAPRLLNSRN